MQSIGDLLCMLENITEECENLQTLNESSGDDSMKFVNDKFFALYKKFMHIVNSVKTAYLTPDMTDLIIRVKKVHMTQDYKVMTYPNIHNEKKYNVKADMYMKYINRAIDESLNNPGKTFNMVEINHAALSYTLKSLIGTTPKKYIDLDEFRDAYRKYAFGGENKILMYPKINTLTNLAMTNPYILNYIDDKLISNHVKSLRNYVSTIDTDFQKLVKSHPEMATRFNTYVSCMEMAVKNILSIYQIIRKVFEDLNSEYKRIFKKVLSIDREMNYSVNYESVTSFVNPMIKGLRSLTESIDDENLKNKESFNQTKKESLISLIDKYNEHHSNQSNRLQHDIDWINKYIGKISLIDIDKIDPEYFSMLPIGTLQDFPDNAVNIIKDSVLTTAFENKRKLITYIFENTPYLGCISTDDSNIVGVTITNIKNLMIGKSGWIKPNIELFANNLIKQKAFLCKVSNEIKNISESNINKLKEILNNEKTGEFNNEMIERLINNDLVYITILDCMYKNVYYLASSVINSISNMIEDKNNEI